MLINACSTHYIQATAQWRSALWRNLIGENRMPVKTAKPRWMCLPGYSDEVLAYDLDAGRLTEAQRAAFAGYISRRLNMPYEQAKQQLDGWPLKAAGVEPVTAEPDNFQERPLLLFPRIFGNIAFS